MVWEGIIEYGQETSHTDENCRPPAVDVLRSDRRTDEWMSYLRYLVTYGWVLPFVVSLPFVPSLLGWKKQKKSEKGKGKEKKKGGWARPDQAMPDQTRKQGRNEYLLILILFLRCHTSSSSKTKKAPSLHP